YTWFEPGQSSPASRRTQVAGGSEADRRLVPRKVFRGGERAARAREDIETPPFFGRRRRVTRLGRLASGEEEYPLSSAIYRLAAEGAKLACDRKAYFRRPCGRRAFVGRRLSG